VLGQLEKMVTVEGARVRRERTLLQRNFLEQPYLPKGSEMQEWLKAREAEGKSLVGSAERTVGRSKFGRESQNIKGGSLGELKNRRRKERWELLIYRLEAQIALVNPQFISAEKRNYLAMVHKKGKSLRIRNKKGTDKRKRLSGSQGEDHRETPIKAEGESSN